MSLGDATKMARKIVRQELPGDWVIQPMGRDCRDFSVRRPLATKNPLANQAFDFSYRLRNHRDVEDCEPALMLPAEAPDGMRDEHAVMLEAMDGASAGASSSSSSDLSEHLGCTDPRNWALQLCQAPQAWSTRRPRGGKAQGDGILIGHPDTGYTLHPQLDSSRVLARDGRDFEDGDANPSDPLVGKSPGHGTATGSVIISGVDSDVTGVVPQAKLIPLRVTKSVVLFSYGKLTEAIYFASDNGHHVLSISLGGPLSSRFLRRAVR
jgi:hypothetical protein